MPGRVLLEAVYPTEQTESGLYLGNSLHDNRYPSLGFVVALHDNVSRPHSLAKDDLVLIRDEGRNTDTSTYYDVFSLTLRDHKERLKILVDSVVEPVVREHLAAHRRSPATYNRDICVQDVQDDQWYTFKCSDIEDLGFEELAHPTWKMEYLPTYMLNLNNGPGTPFLLHYIIDERNIIAILREID